jgi:hypothetical protein
VRDEIPPTPTPPKCVVGPPREGEVWSVLRRLGHAGVLLRCRDAFEASGVCCCSHPSRRAFGPPQDEEPRTDFVRRGGAPKSANPMASRSLRRPRGRLSARHMRICSKAVAHAYLR